MISVYTAGPLFTEEDLKACEAVENCVNSIQFCKFHSPRLMTTKEGSMLNELNKKIASNTLNDKDKKELLVKRDDAANKILAVNIYAIKESDIIIANIDNRDTGTMFEIGYAYALSKPIITYSFNNFGSNVMISQSCVAHCDKITLTDTAQLKTMIEKLIDLLQYKDEEYHIEFYRNKLNTLCDYQID